MFEICVVCVSVCVKRRERKHAFCLWSTKSTFKFKCFVCTVVVLPVFMGFHEHYRDLRIQNSVFFLCFRYTYKALFFLSNKEHFFKRIILHGHLSIESIFSLQKCFIRIWIYFIVDCWQQFVYLLFWKIVEIYSYSHTFIYVISYNITQLNPW